LSGTGTPTATVGTTKDFYLDTTTEMLYGPKTGGAWPATGTSLVGPTGPAGPSGPVCTAPFKSINDQGDDLVGCTLENLGNLGKVNLEGANLFAADLVAVFLVDARLTGANLTDASLAYATLAGASLNYAHLTHAHLTHADLVGSTWAGAKVTGVTWTHTTCPDGSTSTANGGTCAGSHL
jgi:uncharacterized protein YjbI with pentapeptide repeats